MDVVRNFIHVIGITPEDELPRIIKGQVIQYSDIETIFIPDHKPGAESIFQVMVDVNITSSKVINTPMSRIMVIDGMKKFKIIYAEKGGVGNAAFLTLSTPYNTFIDIPQGSDVNNVSVYIIDAYFSLIDSRKIYSYILYMVYANHLQGEGAKDDGEAGFVEDAATLREVPGGAGSDKFEGQKDDQLVDIDSEFL